MKITYTFFNGLGGRPLDGEFPPLVGDVDVCFPRETKIGNLGADKVTILSLSVALVRGIYWCRTSIGCSMWLSAVTYMSACKSFDSLLPVHWSLAAHFWLLRPCETTDTEG